MTPCITVFPELSLVHEEVNITVDCLEPEQIYRIELRLYHKLGTYRSFGVYKSNASGEIDLDKSKPIRGTYAEINKNGLFQTVEPTEDVKRGTYCRCTPVVDFKYQLLVMNTKGKIVGEKSFLRKLQHPLVERIEIEELFPENNSSEKPKVTGTIFKPPGNGPFPSILDMSGAGAGLNEQRGAALASRGFAVLSLAFFRYKNLPDEMFDVDLQYFEDAMNYFISLPYTSKKIGLQGISFGGTIVMFLATKYPWIKAVCSINGSYAFDEVAHIKIYGEEPPMAIATLSLADVRFLNGLVVYDELAKNWIVEGDAKFKIENTSPETAFRFVTSMDDFSTPTIYSTNYFASQLRQLGRKVDVWIVAGGHLMEPPCFPHHPMVYNGLGQLYQIYGGETSIHGINQQKTWEGTIQFFTEHLGKPTPLPDFPRTTAKL